MIVSNKTLKKISKIKNKTRRIILYGVVRDCDMYAVTPNDSKFYLKGHTLVAEWNEETWHTYKNNNSDPFETWHIPLDAEESFKTLVHYGKYIEYDHAQ